MEKEDAEKGGYETEINDDSCSRLVRISLVRMTDPLQTLNKLR